MATHRAVVRLSELQQGLQAAQPAANEENTTLGNCCLVCQGPFRTGYPYGRITAGGSNEAQCQAVAKRILAAGLDSGVCCGKCLRDWDQERSSDALAAEAEFWNARKEQSCHA